MIAAIITRGLGVGSPYFIVTAGLSSAEEIPFTPDPRRTYAVQRDSRSYTVPHERREWAAR